MRKSRFRFSFTYHHPCDCTRIIFFIPLLFFFLQISAQDQSEKGLPFITNYTAKTYKALPQTWCVQEDNRGIMYFGIQNYILEYDGIKWRKITAGTNTSTVVRSMAKNKDGLIYYGAYSDLGYFDKDSLGQTTTKSLLDLIPAANRDFLDIWSAYSAGDNVYFQSREYVFRISEKKADGKRDVKIWKPQTRFMYSFYIEGDYYVHQQGLGLFKMINDSLVLVPGSEFLGKERMQVMLPYPAGPNGEKQYLVGQFYSGLYIYNGKTFRPFTTKADNILKSGVVLYKGIQLQNGNYVLSSTGKGLIIIDAQGNLLQTINRAVGLQDESIYAVYLDKKGTLWLALDNGISRVETASPLTQFNLQSGITTAVSTVTRFAGDIYVGTTNGLLRYDQNRQYFELVPGIAQNQIFSLVPDGDELLIAGDGLFAVKNKKAFTIRKSVSGDLTLSALCISKKIPGLLLCGGTSGVTVFKKKVSSGDWEFKGYIPGITDQIWTFIENNDGTFWAGAANGWDYKINIAFDDNGNLDREKTSFKKYGVNDGYPNGVGSVVSVKGINYFLADSSLFTFDDSKKRYVPDTTFGKFPNGGGATESALIEDAQGRVWIRFGKETRLAIPKPAGGYSIENTQLNSINDLTIQSFYPEKNGIVWVCTTDGLIRYDQNLEKNSDQSFKTILRHVEAEKTSLSTDTSDKKSVSISFKNNTLRFEYAAPFFEQEDKTQYQTWLEGFENDWSTLDNNYYKEYTNLPAGNYTFHVRAQNIYRKLSDEAIYKFEILPPWYRTWWAYLLYAVVAAIVIYSLIRWRTKQLHEKHRELEKIVTQRTGELKQKAEELAVINSVQEGLAKELDMQAIYELVGNKIQKVFNAQAVLICTFDHEKKLEHFNYHIEKGEISYPAPRPYDKLRQHMIDTKEKIYINDHNETTAAQFNMKVVPGTQLPKSLLFVPLISGDTVKSYVSLQNIDSANAFSESDVRLLETLANSMSVALENARLFDETNRLLKETEQRTGELAVINSVQEGLAKELDMQGIYNLIGDRVQKLFNAQAVIIASFDLDNKIEHFNYLFENGEKVKAESRPINKLRQLLIDKKHSIYISTEEQAIKEYGLSAIPGTKMSKSLLFVPLLTGNIIRGYVSLQNVDVENAFSDSDIRLLETLANSMSVALENARLFDETNRLLKETEQRQAELAVINSVQEGLVREMNIQAIYDLVGNRICELFDTQTVIIRTFDRKAETEQWQYAIERGQRLYSNPRPLIWANSQLIKSKQPLLINENYEETAKKFGGVGVSKGLPPKSAIFVPMIVGETVRGSISLQNVEKENAFSDTDLRLLTTLTNSMSVAIENARLFDETTHLLADAKQRAKELSTVNNISRALASQLDSDELIELVGDHIKNLFKANIVYLALINKKTKIIYFPYQFGDELTPMKLGEGLTSKIILSGEPLLINKDVQELTTQLGVKRVGVPAASYLGVPIPIGDEIIGVLSVQSTEHENRFDENDMRLLSTIASSVGVALRNAQLFEEVHVAKKEAEAASKTAEKANAAKSAFLSTVSHELRTPLTSVLGFAKIIRKRLEEKIFPAVDKSDTKTEKTINQISENLQVVISEGERLTHLINDVLDLAKIEAGKMEWNLENVSMPEVAERAIAATTSLFDQKNLKLIRQIESNTPEISGDRDKLIQVIINLISNSVKFTDKGSVTCRLHANEEEVIVSISDTGIGIAKEDYAAVFEQFKQVGGDTLTDKPKGTGLGLPICKEIVEHHGGRIWLESEVGKGSTFSFAIPIVKQDKSKIKPIHLNELVKQLKEQMVFSKLKINGKNATILIVDDDDSIRSLLRQELNDAGYLTEEATNGKEALECIRKNRPDLIILDVMMPEINGFDVAAILKNDPQTMDIPIIVLSIVQDKARGFRIGVDRYLTKPIDTAQLFTEVGTLLEQGKSKRKVMVVDEDSAAVRTLTDVLHAKGYQVVESDGKELIEKAIATQPDIIILNSILSAKQEIVQTLRFEKGLENVLFFIYQ